MISAPSAPRSGSRRRSPSQVDRRGRSDDIERDPVMRGGDGETIRSDLVRGVAVGGDPVGAGDDAVDLAEAHQVRGGRVGDHRVRDAERLELPGGQPRALEERPRLVDPDVREEAVLPRCAQRADGRAVAAVASPPALQCVRAFEPGPKRAAACAPMRRQRSTSAACRARARSGEGSARSCSSAQTEVDRRRPRLGEDAVGRVEVLPALGRKRIAVRGRNADRRSTAHRERPDRVRDLGRRLTAELDFLVRKPALVE